MNLATTPKGDDMIVLTSKEYETLKALAEDATDVALLNAAKIADDGCPTLPLDLFEDVMAGEMHPLTAWRKVTKMTQASLAKKAGIRVATLSDIEGGKIDPRFGTVKALADALGVGIDDVMPA